MAKVRKRQWVTPTGERREAWIVDFTDQAGRHIKTFVRKKDADAYLARVRVDLNTGVHTSSKATVAHAGEVWITDAAQRLERATVDAYRQHLDQHIVPLIGDVKLADLTVPKVRAFADELRGRGRSPTMIRKVIGDLGSILADAQERGLVAQNVVRNLSYRKKRTKQTQRRKLQVGVDIPSPDEIRALVSKLEGRWRPLILTAIFSGLRASELRGLPWANVDLKTSVIHVRQRADRYSKIDKPKSEAGERTVPVPPILVKTLREWRLACPRSALDLVFPTGTGNVENHSNIVHRGLEPTMIAAGVVTADGKPKYTGLHALRHFYASWLINRQKDGGLGLPLKVVQYRLGHSTITMTADVYGHLFPTGDDGDELAMAEKALLG
jgi:integrase